MSLRAASVGLCGVVMGGMLGGMISLQVAIRTSEPVKEMLYLEENDQVVNDFLRVERGTPPLGMSRKEYLAIAETTPEIQAYKRVESRATDSIGEHLKYGAGIGGGLIGISFFYMGRKADL